MDQKDSKTTPHNLQLEAKKKWSKNGQPLRTPHEFTDLEVEKKGLR
jgi:hypothetical protein